MYISLEVRAIKYKNSIKKLVLMMLVLSLFSMNLSAFGEENNIEMNFRGVDLKDAFRAIADISGMNIITDKSVAGPVTVDLKNIPALEAIELLAKTNGLDYRIVGNTVLIGSPEKLKNSFDKRETRVFKLENAIPKDIQKSLELLVGKDSIEIDTRTNSLIVSAYKKEMKDVEKVIFQLDEAKKQVMIEARIEDISRDELDSMGINWNFAKETVSNGASIIWDNVNATKEANVVEVGDVTMDYKSVLGLLKKNGDSVTLANPHLSTIDGKEAVINIGQEIPIIRETKSDDETTREVEFRTVGTILKLTPRITNGAVSLSISQETSSLDGYIDNMPKINTKNVTTNVMVNDGKTIAIGGLVSDEQIEELSKVPLLGDVPLLGKLFRERKVKNDKRELVIFITPKIIDISKEAKEDQETTNLRTAKYLVRKYDTLWSIGKAFNISFAKIMDYNDIESPQMLELGQILKIPVPANRYYTVAKDDDLRSLAERYDIDIQDIKKINNLETLEGKAGEYIVLPVAVK
ncbi:LysM peptidoglycan-binding domain-containing protein [Orenia marismortui]|uniref:LysM peptidoglycan-binding domain-containing protein n=1 Tax=Orenia marismortui TaxID=46469 RepID=UPI0003756644|nr:LysM peptidoglycan-binding domain-containing protein [Orenia marismortui]